MTEEGRIQPVFIGGCPRSGTTLLASLLARQPDFFAVPESPFKVEVFLAAETAGSCLEQAAASLEAHWRFRMWNVRLTGKHAGTFSIEGMRAIVEDCFVSYRDANFSNDLRIAVDHTPENVIWAHTLLRLFPGARFVHLIRDPRAVAQSVMPLDWGPNTARQAALWWLRYMFHGLTLEATLPARQILRIRYEELVADPESTLDRLNDFLGTPRVQKLADSMNLRLPEYTRRQHSYVGGDLRKGAIDRWKSDLSGRQIKAIESELRDSMPLLGYAPRFNADTKRRRDHLSAGMDAALNHLIAVINYGKYSIRRYRFR